MSINNANDNTSASNKQMETLEELLIRTINIGAPIYNKGDKRGCYELYIEAAKHACSQPQLFKAAVGQLLESATEEAMEVIASSDSEIDYDQAAWILRRCFDSVLASSSRSMKRDGDEKKIDDGIAGGTTSSSNNPRRSTVIAIDNATAELIEDGDDAGSVTSSTSGSTYYWQDEKTQNRSEIEQAQCLADIYTILVSSVEVKSTITRYTKTYKNCFFGDDIVETLVTLGLASHRKQAVMKGNMLRAVGLLKSVSHGSENKFHDGTHLYRFPTINEELKSSLDKLMETSSSILEGSEDSLSLLTLKAIFDLPLIVHEDHVGALKDVAPSTRNLMLIQESRRRLSAITSTDANKDKEGLADASSSEHLEGIQLAEYMKQIQPLLDIKDRKYNLRTYEKCFVGNEIVTTIVNHESSSNDSSLLATIKKRETATSIMNKLLRVGFISHVTKDHEFNDGKYFYSVTTNKNCQQALDSYSLLSYRGDGDICKIPTGHDLVRQTALIHHLKNQYAGLTVTEILNSFYGCNGKGSSGSDSNSSDCWDVVNLSIWRYVIFCGFVNVAGDLAVMKCLFTLTNKVASTFF